MIYNFFHMSRRYLGVFSVGFLLSTLLHYGSLLPSLPLSLAPPGAASPAQRQASAHPSASPSPAPVDPSTLPMRFVFFDIGTNDAGSLVSFLLRRGRMKEDGYPPVLHTDAAALQHRPQWHVVAVEANPRYSVLLQQKCDFYMSSGLTASCTVVPAALTTFDGNVTLHLDKPGGAQGASIRADSNSVKDRGLSTTVPAVDVLTLFSAVLPLRRQDYAVVKVDVEGEEYAVLQRALANGHVALWDELYVEWHANSQFVFGGTAAGLQAECTQRSLKEAFGSITTFPAGIHLQAQPWA